MRSSRILKKHIKFYKLQKKVLNSKRFKKYGLPEWTLPVPCGGTIGSLKSSALNNLPNVGRHNILPVENYKIKFVDGRVQLIMITQ